jgi:hypothetical protein
VSRFRLHHRYHHHHRPQWNWWRNTNEKPIRWWWDPNPVIVDSLPAKYVPFSINKRPWFRSWCLLHQNRKSRRPTATTIPNSDTNPRVALGDDTPCAACCRMHLDFRHQQQWLVVVVVVSASQEVWSSNKCTDFVVRPTQKKPEQRQSIPKFANCYGNDHLLNITTGSTSSALNHVHRNSKKRKLASTSQQQPSLSLQQPAQKQPPPTSNPQQ